MLPLKMQYKVDSDFEGVVINLYYQIQIFLNIS